MINFGIKNVKTSKRQKRHVGIVTLEKRRAGGEERRRIRMIGKRRGCHWEGEDEEKRGET